MNNLSNFAIEHTHKRSNTVIIGIMIHSIKISAVIITYNEEKKIEACVKSLLEVADEIIVIDSCSTDQTEAICSRYPVKFIKHPFEGYVAQKNYAMRQASHHYILSLDADERLSAELRKSINEVKNNWNGVHGYVVNRLNNYCGQWIRHSGWYPDRKIRLWDRRTGEWGGTDPHDSVMMSMDKVKKLKGDLLHYPYLSVDEHLLQGNKFAEIAARAKYRNGERPYFIKIVFSPFLRFIKNYFLQLGFLDGYYGFIISINAAIITFYKYLRLYEYTRNGLPEEGKEFRE